MNETQQRLGDFVELQRGTTYKSKLLGSTGPVLLGLASIQRNGGFRNDSLKCYAGESDGNILLKPNDLFASLKDVTQAADLLGAVARVPSVIEQGRLTQDTVKLCFNQKEIDKTYIYWLLRTPQYREYCRAHATGTTNLGLSRHDFLSFPVPSFTASRKNLVTLLETLDDKIAINESISAKALKLADYHFTQTTKSATTSTTLGMLMREDKVEFGDGYRTKRAEHGHPGIPILRVAEVHENSIHPALEDYVRSEFRNSMGEKISRPDDIVLTTKGTVGRVAIIPANSPEFVYSPQICYFRTSNDPSFSNNYLFHWFRGGEFWNQAGALKGNTDMADYLSLRDIRSLTISIPEELGMRKFEEKVGPLRQLMDAMQEESRVLASLRDTLLPQLVSGRLRVKEAQKIVEDAT